MRQKRYSLIISTNACSNSCFWMEKDIQDEHTCLLLVLIPLQCSPVPRYNKQNQKLLQ